MTTNTTHEIAQQHCKFFKEALAHNAWCGFWQREKNKAQQEQHAVLERQATLQRRNTRTCGW
ncbi:MAG: hypothetical protein CMF50_04860 [Legionellales bacterium]|mgnify:CR=1 FL=1|nr:hypothetical protein [Legionellales bacterium]|tara:strand:- start:16922 stop:17107 length:186 start_codon:yes stop_codon:yes gene_type:complete